MPAADAGITAETDPSVEAWAKTLPSARFVTTGSVLDLASVITAGTFGSSTQVPILKVDAFGRVTEVSLTTITGTSPVGSALASGHIWLGDTSNQAAPVPLAGDISITSSGTVAVNRVKGQAFSGNAPGAGSILSYNNLSGHWEAVTLPSCTGAQTIYFDSLTGGFSCAAVNSSVNFSGNLAGDLTGTQGATTLSRLQGQPLQISTIAARDTLVYNGSAWVNANIPSCGANQYLTFNGTYFCVTDTGSAGVVTSVDVAVPSFMSTSGGPVTSAGTISLGFQNQNANLVFAGPASGGAAAPAFRSLAADDIPNLDAAKIAAGTLPVSRGGTGSGAALTNNKVMVSAGNAIVEGNGFGSAKANNSFVVRDAAGGFAAANVEMDAAVLKGSSAGSLILQVPASVTSYSLTFPDTLGSAGQVLLTNASGQLTWGTPSAGSVTSVSSSNAYLTVANGTSSATLTLNVGTAANTVAAGNDSRIVGAVQRSGDTMAGALHMGGQDLVNVGNITMASDRLLGMGQFAADPDTTGWNNSQKGRTWFHTGSNQIKYWDGSSIKVLGVAGSGLQSLNGLTENNQSFALGASGTDANIVSTGSVHTINLPTASASNRGLLSVTDWLAFNNKLSSSSQFAGDVSGTVDAISVNRIRGVPVTGSLNTNNFLKYNGSAWVGSDLTTADVTTGLGYAPLQSLNGLTAQAQSFVTGTSGTAPAYQSAGSTHVLNIPMASAGSVTAGLISKSDYDAFNAKLGTTTSFAGDVAGPFNAITVNRLQGQNLVVSSGSLGQVLRYNGSAWVNTGLSFADITAALAYAPVNRAGDTMSGVLNLGGNDLGNAGNVQMAAEKVFGLSQYTGDPSTAGWGSAQKGRTWFNASTNEIKYWDGSTIRALGVSGSGIQNLNGLTANNQSFEVAATGTDFTITSSGSTHTFNLPTASGANRGLLSSADFTTFNQKLSSSQQFSGDVSGTVAAITVGRLRGTSVTVVGSLASGEFLRYNGSAWVNQVLSQADVTTGLGYLPLNRAGDTMTGALNMSGRNIAGVGTLSLAGAGSLSLLPGTGTYTLTFPNSLGANGQVLMTNASGALSWGTVSTATNVFTQGGNTFGAAANLGTNDNYDLSFETNNTIRMTINSTGQIGVGRAPSTSFSMDVNGDIRSWGNLSLVNSSAPPAGVISISKDLGHANGFSPFIAMERDGGAYSLLQLGYLSNGTTDIATGIYSPNSSLVFGTGTTAATERMRIDTAGNIGIGTTAPGRLLHVNGPMRLTAAALPGSPVAGDIAIDSGSGNALRWYNGTGWATAGGSGGITSINGLTASAQTMIFGSSGTAPAFAADGSTHTLNIPMSSASGVTAGLLSRAEFDTFNNKLGTTSAFSGDVSGTFNNVTVNRIRGQNLALGTGTLGQFLKFNGSAWVNTPLTNAEITTGLGYTPLAAGNYFAQGGNSFGASAVLGTNDNQSLSLRTNGTNRITIGATGTTTLSGQLQVPGGSSPVPGLVFSNDTGTGFTSNGTVLSLVHQGSDVIGVSSTAVSISYPTNLWEVIAWQDGTAAAPKVRFMSDVNTGLFLPAADNLAVTTNGTERLRIGATGHVGIGTTSPTVRLDIAGSIRVANGGETCSAGANGGVIRYNSGVLEFCNGTGWQALGVAGSGLSNLNGLTGATQSFAVSSTGTDFTITSSGSTHTFNLPTASGTSRGLLSSADFTAFSQKLGSSQVFAGDVSGTVAAITVGRIRGTNITTVGTLVSGEFLRYNGSAWVNSLLSSSDVTAALGYTPMASGNYFAQGGNSFGAAAVLGTMDNFPMALRTGGSTRMYVTEAGNIGIGTTNPGSLFEIRRTGGSFKLGAASAGSASRTEIQFAEAGGSVISLSYDGSPTDPNNVLFIRDELNSIDRFAFTQSGSLGIGTTAPGAVLDVSGDLNLRGMASVGTSPFGQGRIYFDSASGKFRVSQNGAAFVDLVGSGGGITAINGLTGALQSFAIGTTGVDANIVSTGSLHTINLPTASGTSRGLLSIADFTAFNAKVNRSGDTMTGILNMGGRNIANVGTLSLAGSGTLSLLPGTGTYSLTFPNALGSNGQVLMTDASGNLSWGTVSAGGITSFNGLTASSQTLAVVTTGTLPGVASLGSTHTLNIPMASTANAVAGLISRADYDSFNAKVNRSGDTMTGALVMGGRNVSGVGTLNLTGSGTLSLRTAGGNYSLTFPTGLGTNGQVLMTDASGNLSWGTSAAGGITAINGLTGALQSFAIGTTGVDANIVSTGSLHTINLPTASGTSRGLLSIADFTAFNAKVNRSGDTMTGILNMGGRNIANVGTLSLAGSGTLSLLPGTGTYSLTFPNALGTNGQVLMTSATGVLSWGTVSSGTTGFVQNGNAFGTQAILGTNDSNNLAFETNSATRMTITAAGSIGIGTTAPGALLQVHNSSANSGLAVSRVNDATAQATVAYWPAAATSPTNVSWSTGMLMNSNSYQITNFDGSGTNYPFTITNTGNVGVGTVAPARLLHVNGPMRLTAGTLPGTPGLGDIAIDTGSGNALRWHNGTGWQTAGGSAGASNAYVQGGNAFTATGTLGTNDGYGLHLRTNGTNRMFLDATGRLNIGATTTGTALVNIVGIDNPSGSAVNVLNVQAGSATGGSGVGGGIRMATGLGTASVAPDGDFSFIGGGGPTADGQGGGGVTFNLSGPFTVTTGRAGNDASPISLTGGNGVGFGRGGSINLTGGNGGGASSPSGGSVVLTGGTGGAPNGNGGNITLNGGVNTGSGTVGNVILAASRGNVGIGTSMPGRLLHVAGPVRLAAGTLPSTPGTGDIAIDSTSGNALRWYNGTAWVTAGESGGGITTINGLSAASQTLTVTNTGTLAGFSSLTSTHSLNIPMASTANAVGGLISRSDYDTFSAKVNRTGDTMTGILNMGGRNIANVGTLSLAGSGTLSLLPGTGTYSLTFPNALGSAGQVLMTSASGVLSWGAVSTGTLAFVQDGNTFGTGATLGTNDNFNLNFKTNSSVRMTVDNFGYVGIGTTAPKRPVQFSQQNPGGPTYNLLLENRASNNASSAVLGFSVGINGNSPEPIKAGIAFERTGTDGIGRLHFLVTDQTSTYTVDRVDSKMSISSNGFVGIGTTNPGRILTVAGPIRVAAGTLPGTPAAGDIAIDSGEGNALKWYNGTAWVAAGGSGGGGMPADSIPIYKVRVATTAAITRSGLQTIDGIALVAGDRVLVKNQSPQSENGVYVVSAGAWTRATDLDDWNETLNYMVVVTEGTNWRGMTFSIGAWASGTMGSTPLSWNAIGLSQGNNTAFGYNALISSLGGSTNSAFGFYTLGSNTTGNNNTASGGYALGANTTGYQNTATGMGAMQFNTIGNDNTALGMYTLRENRAKSGSTAVGAFSMANAHDTVTGAISYNTALGAYSLYGSASAASNTGVRNTALGHSALHNMISGSGNVGIGFTAGSAITTGSNNIVIGSNTGSSIATSSNNILIADGAGNERIRVNGSGFVGIGSTNPGRLLEVAGPVRLVASALPGSPAAGDIAIDSSANNALKWYNGTAWVSAGGAGGGGTDPNTLLQGGNSFGASMVLGTNDAQSLQLETNNTVRMTIDSSGRIGIGVAPNSSTFFVSSIDTQPAIHGRSNCGGGSCFGVYGENPGGGPGAGVYGYAGGGSASYGIYGKGWNGSYGGYFESTGGGPALITGSGNVGIGISSPTRLLHVNGPMRVTAGTLPASPTAGDIAIDSGAGNALKWYNGTGWQTAGGSGGGGSGTPGGSDTQIQFNNAGAFGGSANFIWNNASNALTVTGDINYTGVLTDTSDQRLKKDIQTLNAEEMAAKINKIRAVSFRMKNDPRQEIELGVIAQEIEQVFPELVKTANDKMKTKSVNYVGLIGPLVAANQQLKADNDALKSKLAELESRSKEIEQRLQNLEPQTQREPASVGEDSSQKWINMALFAMLLAMGLMVFRRSGSQEKK